MKEKRKQVLKWYQELYCTDENVIYHDTLTLKENIHTNKLISPFGVVFILHASPSHKGGKSTKFLRLEKDT